MRRSGACRGDADKVVEALEPLHVGLSGGLVMEKLLRHEQRGVRRGVRPTRTRVAFWILYMRARGGALFMAGSAPSGAGGRGA